MLRINFSFSLPLILSLAVTLLGCGSDATPEPSPSASGADSGGSSAAGADSGGADSAGADSGGADSAGADSGGADSAGANSAGAPTAGANSAGGAPSAAGPCVYTVSGGQSFPEGDATYLCSGGSRVLQQKGMGDFDILVGAALGTADNRSSTIACSLTSKDAPAAGDIWELGKDHPGNCDLGYSQGMTASLWKSTSTPAGTGSASVKFLSATLMHGKYKPEDVYYLFEVEITATLPGETANTPEVTLNGTFKITTLPLGA